MCSEEDVWVNAEGLLLFVDKYVCGMPKKKSTAYMLFFVTV